MKDKLSYNCYRKNKCQKINPAHSVNTKRDFIYFWQKYNRNCLRVNSIISFLLLEHLESFGFNLRYEHVTNILSGKVFISVFEVLGFIEVDSSGIFHCPANHADITLLTRVS